MLHKLEAELQEDLFGKSTSQKYSLYRGMVRSSLTSVVINQIPVTVSMAGTSTISGWLDKWLEQSPPKEKIYWRLPVEFANWFREIFAQKEPFFSELVHWECISLITENAPDIKSYSMPKQFEQGVLELHPAAQLAIYGYPVFMCQEGDKELPHKSADVNFVLLYRAKEEAYFKVLEPKVAQVLAQLAQGKPLEEAYSFLESLYGGFDVGHIKAQLRSLAAAQIIRG